MIGGKTSGSVVAPHHNRLVISSGGGRICFRLCTPVARRGLAHQMRGFAFLPLEYDPIGPGIHDHQVTGLKRALEELDAEREIGRASCRERVSKFV